MISPDKIEEWIREVEERPSSAPNILRYIARRLSDLAIRNEELLAENIALRTDRKVEEYENRISNLEYQVDLLKRQLGGDSIPSETPAVAGALCLVIYNNLGQVLKLEIDASNLVSSQEIAALQSSQAPEGTVTRLLVASSQEELLFVFDSGRTVALPVAALPASGPGAMDWDEAYLEEPRGGEELAALLPVAKMSLYDFCVQTSRRGYVKKIREVSFESHIASHYIGTGVRLQADKTYDVQLCHIADRLVMVSKEGFCVTLEVDRLPLTIEEALRLNPTDHITATFIMKDKPSILFVTGNGKALHREAGWLETAASYKTRGQSLISKERRLSGVRIVGAAAVDETEWGIALRSDGTVVVHRIDELFATGTLLPGQTELSILGFTTFSGPTTD